MYALRFAALCVALAVVDLVSANDEVALRALTNALIRIATDTPGISPKQKAIAERIQKFGAASIPYLLPLLEHEKPSVRTLAGFVLRDTQGLTEAHLDALIAARLRGDGWIPPAIARIGTPPAMCFLVAELKKERQTETQLTIALARAGKKSAPYLVELFEREPSMDKDLSRAIQNILSNMDETALPAVEPLTRVAADPKRPVQIREESIYALRAIGITARSAVPTLQEIARKESATFAETVEIAITGIGSPEAVPIFLRWLSKSRNICVLRDLSAMGKNAATAGPALLPWLNDDDWELRVGIARTLGFIGFSGAADALARCLANEDDWRLVWVSAQSLGRLQSKSALPALQQTARNHWYPPVREEARKAIRAIELGEAYTSRWHVQNFPFEFFDYESVRMKQPRGQSGYSTGPTLVRELDQLDEVALAKVRYKVEGDNSNNETSSRSTNPNCGLKLEHGLLLGVDQGEWGGELVFQGEHSPTRRLLGENTHAIHRLGSRIIALTGLCHITTNRGMVYRIIQTSNGQWQAVAWKSLPGAPRRSGRMKDGRLFVACCGADIFLNSEGKLAVYGAVNAR